MRTDLQETPIVKIDDIFYKLEYKNPTGSVKDRGVSYQVHEAVKKGYKSFVISSSGNAAISAAYYVSRFGGELTVFVSPKINRKKLAILQKSGCKVLTHNRALSQAVRFAKKNGAYNLRASVDENGWWGYKTLAKEIDDQIGKVGSIFVPVSSGTTFYGIAKGFEELKYLPQLHCVQSTAVNFISRKFDKSFIKSGDSIMDALVARNSDLEQKLLSLIQRSYGSGWVISDEQAKRAWFFLKDKKIITSYEGAAALAAVWKARSKGFKLSEPIVCLLTGQYY